MSKQPSLRTITPEYEGKYDILKDALKDSVLRGLDRKDAKRQKDRRKVESDRLRRTKTKKMKKIIL